MQTATRAAERGRGTFIRKMRHFEESRSVASGNQTVVEYPYGCNTQGSVLYASLLSCLCAGLAESEVLVRNMDGREIVKGDKN